MRIFKPIEKLTVVLALLLWLTACTPMAATALFPAEESQQALQVARQYVNAVYQYNGEEHKGVAYLLGGQDTLDEYLAKVSQGTEPGKEAGTDASDLAISVYRVVYPDLRFIFRTKSGKEVAVKDVSSETLYRYNIEPVAVDQLRPDDLVFFKSPGGRISSIALRAGRTGNSLRIIVGSYSASRVIETGIRLQESTGKNILPAPAAHQTVVIHRATKTSALTALTVALSLI